MKITKLFTGFVVMALLALPAVSMANTYQYIDTSGNLQSMEASNPQEALATAYQLGVHSGVILVEGSNPIASIPANTAGSDNYYEFMDTSSNRQGVWANDPYEALNTAYQLGIHSGVILIASAQ